MARKPPTRRGLRPKTRETMSSMVAAHEARKPTTPQTQLEDYLSDRAKQDAAAVSRKRRADQRIDNLTMLLMSRGLHISQQPVSNQ